MLQDRLEISRLFHRFAFGPKPGQFSAALKSGLAQTKRDLLNVPAIDTGAQSISLPVVTDLGPRPAPNTAAVLDFASAMRSQTQNLITWWLDLMVASDHGLTERLVWFWHGHWATSIAKVDYPLAMYKQNQVFRTYALGDFQKLSRAMIYDGALQFWLDGQTSTLKAPNENLARELMELFILGVNRYSEDDVKSLAKSLTGFRVTTSTGEVEFQPNRHDFNPVTLLGTTKHFTAEEASDFLVARSDCQKFIAERIWYRFISSSVEMPGNFASVNAFSNRSIAAAIQAAAYDPAMSDAKNQMVKAPVEWFVSACRALELIPSKLESSAKLIQALSALGQLPFNPPNVGGWPAAEAWLSSASAQYRINLAQWLVKQSSLRAIKEFDPDRWFINSADWLGVSQWSPRTQAALRESLAKPTEFAVLALTSPEYVVNA